MSTCVTLLTRWVLPRSGIGEEIYYAVCFLVLRSVCYSSNLFHVVYNTIATVWVAIIMGQLLSRRRGAGPFFFADEDEAPRRFGEGGWQSARRDASYDTRTLAVFRRSQ